MNTPEHILALQCQMAVGILALLSCSLLFRIPLLTSLWAVILFNSLPLVSVPGFETPLFAHDFLLPVLMLLTLLTARLNEKIFVLAALAVLIWPLVGIGVALLSGIEGYQWITFAYRRLGFLVFLLFGLSGLFPRIRAKDFFDACVVVWGFMLVPALLQYFGFIDTDIHALGDGDLRGLSILDSSAAQRGFLGLNRGAVGVWGSAVATYCLGQYFFNRELDRMRWLLYTVVPSLSYVVILFSGTRTGVLAASGGVVFLLIQGILVRGRIPIGRLATFWAVVGVAGFLFLGPVTTRIVERFNFKTAAGGTGNSRLGVQQLTLNYVAGDWRAALVGMGASEAQFLELVGYDTDGQLNHPHSEFVEMLWQGGFLGLALYAALLIAIFTNMRLEGNASNVALAVSGQGMLVAGMISGLAVGNMMITTSRLASFGMLMAFVYGRLIHDLRMESHLSDCAESPISTDKTLMPEAQLTRFSTSS